MFRNTITKKIVSYALAIIMCFGVMPVSLFASDDDQTQLICREQVCGDVNVKVYAPEGAFPDDAELVVTALTDGSAAKDAVEEAISEKRNADSNITKSYYFDIKFVDNNGDEIEPDTSCGNIAVSFETALASDPNLTAAVYHISTPVKAAESAVDTQSEEQLAPEIQDDEAATETDVLELAPVMSQAPLLMSAPLMLMSTPMMATVPQEETETETEVPAEESFENLCVEALSVSAAGGALFVETDSFSYYVVEFTYEKKEYKVVNYEEFSLEEVTSAAGLVGNIEEYESSDEDGLILDITDDTVTPMGPGVVNLVVTIGGIGYKIEVSVAEREDSEVGGGTKESEKDLSGVPEALRGRVVIDLGVYNGSESVNLTTSIPKIDDLLVTSSSLKNKQVRTGLFNKNAFEHAFLYNSEKEWYIQMYSASGYSSADVEGFFETDVEGLQILPFAVFVGTDETPQLHTVFYDGKIQYDEYFASYPAKNGYYYDSRGEYEEILGVMPERNLYDIRNAELQLVYGYIICDADYNYGYKEIGRSNVFTYTYDSDTPAYKIVYADDYSYELKTVIGQPVDLFQGITIEQEEGAGYYLEAKYEFDFVNMKYRYIDGSEWYSMSYSNQYNPLTKQYDIITYYYQYYDIYLKDADGNTVTSWGDERYLYIYCTDYFFSLNGPNAYETNCVYIVPTEKDVEAAKNNSGSGGMNLAAASTSYDYSRPVVADSSKLIDQFADCFYKKNKDGSISHVDKSWVELESSYISNYYYHPDEEFECPYVWDDEDTSNCKCFYLIFTVTDPEDIKNSQRVLITAYECREEVSFQIYFYANSYPEFYSSESKKSCVVGGNINEAPVTKIEIEQGKPDSWVLQIYDMLRGEYKPENYYPSFNNSLNISAEITYRKEMGYAYSSSTHNYYCFKGNNDNGTSVFEQSAEVDLPVRIVGSLDINTIGKYNVKLMPIIDGIANEDLSISFEVSVVPKREMSVSINNAKDIDLFRTLEGFTSTSFSAASLKAAIEKDVVAKNEYNVEIPYEYEIKNSKSQIVSLEDIASNPLEETYTLTYIAYHPKDATVMMSEKVELVVHKTNINFSGLDELTLTKGNVADYDVLTTGITAKAVVDGQEKAESIKLSLKETNYTLDAAEGTYTVTVSAIHPDTGYEFLAARTIIVSDNSIGTGVLKLTLASKSGIEGNDGNNFVLGRTTGIMNGGIKLYLDYDSNNDTKSSIKVYLPYGFSVSAATASTSTYVMTSEGSATDEKGVVLTFVANEADKDAVIQDEFTIIPNMSVLYPQLVENGGNMEYEITAQSFSDGLPSGDCTLAKVILKNSDTVAKAEDFSVVAGTTEFTPAEVFGYSVNTGYYSDGSCVSSKKPYTIVVNKPEGSLVNKNFKLKFDVPQGLQTQDSYYPYYPFIIEAKSSSGAVIHSQCVSENSLASGTIEIPLFATSENYVPEYGVSYFDILRQATSFEIKMYFSTQPADASLLKINLPLGAPSGNGKANEGVMEGSVVSFYNGGDEVSAQSSEKIGVKLVNASSTLDGTNDNVSEILLQSMMGSIGRNGYDTGLTSITSGETGIHGTLIYSDDVAPSYSSYLSPNYNIYKNLQLTVEYPYEYGPVSLYVPKDSDINRLQYVDIYYSVSSAKSGSATLVEGKENIKVKKEKEVFDLDSSNLEYVSSITVKWKANPLLCYNWSDNNTFDINYAGGTASLLGYPIVNVEARTTDAMGNALKPDEGENSKQVVVTSTAIDDRYTLTSVIQPVKLVIPEYDIDVYAADYSDTTVTVNENSGLFEYYTFSDRSVQVGLGVSASTKYYENPVIVITGDALRLVDFGNIEITNATNKESLKVIGYSTSEEISLKATKNQAEATLWITDSAKVEEAVNANFENLVDGQGNPVPVTGILFDISGLSYGGRTSIDPLQTTIIIPSKSIWHTTKFFDELALEAIKQNGSFTPSYSVGLIYDGMVSPFSAYGKTATIVAGKLLTGLTQNDADHTIDPFAGDEYTYHLDEMSLIKINFTSEGNASYFGNISNAALEFTANNEKEKALLSLSEGVALFSNNEADASVYYETVKADGTTATKAAVFVYDYSYNSYCDNSFAPFVLEKGEYPTKVVVSFVNAVDRTQVPSVSLVRVSDIPDQTFSGYTLNKGTGNNDGEQLPVSVSLSFSNWLNENKSFKLDGVSARMLVSPEKVLSVYSPSASKASGSAEPKMGADFTVVLKNYFEFENPRLGTNRTGICGSVANGNGDQNNGLLKYNVYYKLAKGYEYAGAERSNNVKISFYPYFFSDGSGLMKLSATKPLAADNNYTDNVIINLHIGSDASKYQTTVFQEVYFDISDDIKNAEAERGYVLTTGALALTDITEKDKINAKFGITKAIKHAGILSIDPDDSIGSATVIVPTLVSEDGAVQKGSIGQSSVTTVSSIDVNSFGLSGEFIRNTSSTDWILYIPVPKKDRTVTGANDIFGINDFDMTLAEAVTAIGSNAAVEYSTDSFVGIPEYASYAQAGEISDFADVTAIKITYAEVSQENPAKFNLTFANTVKDAVGNMADYAVVYYINSAETEFKHSRLAAFELIDYYIEGSVFDDANSNGIKDSDEGMLAGILVSVDNQGPIIEYKENAAVTTSAITDASGNYKLAVPHAGDYIVKLTKSGNYDLTTKNAEGSTEETRSIANVATGETDPIAISDNVKNINFGLVTLGISADDFYYGIVNGVISSETAVKLAGAKALGLGGGDKDLSAGSVDEAELAVINQAIADGTLDKFPLTFSYQETGASKQSKTISVYLRANGSAAEDGKDYITAEDFEWSIASELTASNARKYAFVNAKNYKGEVLSVSNILVDADQLAAINASVAAMELGQLPLTFRTKNTVASKQAEVTVLVTLIDSSTKKGKIASSDYITANNFTYDLVDGITYSAISGQLNKNGTLSAVELKEIAKVSAIDSNGYDIPSSELVIEEADLTKFNTAITSRKPGKYGIRISHTDDKGTDDTSDDVKTTIKVYINLIDDFIVILDGNGATPSAVKMNPISVVYGDTLTLPENTYARNDGRIAYTFSGWATSAKGSAAYTDKYELTATQVNTLYKNAKYSEALGNNAATLYAVWTKVPGTNTVNVSVVAQSAMKGTKDVSVSIYYKGVSEKDPFNGSLTAQTPYNVSFAALYSGDYEIKVSCGDYSETKTVSLGENQTKDIVFNVVGELIYTVNFDLNGGDEMNGKTSQAWKSATTYTMPVATRSGFTFVGWKTEDGSIYPEGMTAINLCTGEEARPEITLTAVWEPVKYTTVFDANGGLCARASVSLVAGALYGTLPTPVHQYASFDAWYTQAAGGFKVTTSTAATAKDTTIYARWNYNTYNVTYAGISSDTALTASYGSDFTFKVEDVSKTYDISVKIGEKTCYPIDNQDGTYTIKGEDIIADISISAVLADANFVTITYMFEDQVVARVKADKTASFPAIGLPEKEGYSVDGWFDAETSGNKVEGLISGNAARILYAQAEKNTYSFTFAHPDGDIEVFTSYGAVITPPPAPTTTAAFVFTGWQAEDGSTIVYNGSTPTAFYAPAKPMTFSALWARTGNLKVIVNDTKGQLVEGAQVRILKGGVVVYASPSLTDVNGEAFFTSLIYGSYNVEVTNQIEGATSNITTTIGKDITSDLSTVTVTVPEIKINTKLSSDEYNVSVNNLDKAVELTNAEKNEAKPASSKEISIIMEVEATVDTSTDDAISAENKNIKDNMDAKVLEDSQKESTVVEVIKKLVEYVDITVRKKVTTVENGISTVTSEPVTETAEYQIISVEIMHELYDALGEFGGNVDNILIYRMHNGKTEAMRKVEDEAHASGECYWIKTVEGVKYIVIRTRSFSTYAFGVQNIAVANYVEPQQDNPIYYYYVPTEKKSTGVEKFLIMDDHIAYMRGYKDGTILPDANITRAEAAMMFYTLLKNKDVEITAGFTDVENGKWYAKAINTLASMGIVRGYDKSGNFGPDLFITRAEFVELAMSFAEKTTGKKTFNDVSEKFWARESIEDATYYGWISGYNDGSFKPNADITRAEAATMVNSMLERSADKSFVEKNVDKLASFSDLKDNTKWYYYEMVEAANAHDFAVSDTLAGDTVERWKKLK